MSHPDFLPTGKPTVGRRRSYGELPPENRLGIGVVGLHEGHTMLVALRASGLCRAVAGCDLELIKREAAREASPGIFATEHYEELLSRPEVDVVAIYTPDHLHAEQIVAALEAGKHVICTKPLINNVSQIPGLLKSSKQSGKRLQVGQSTRFYEPFLRMRELHDAGHFGRVEAFDAHYNHRMDWWYEKSPWSIAETHWAYLGLSHPVDLVRWYLPDIVRVQAMGSTSELGRRFGLPTPDVITVNLQTSDGRIGRVFGHYGFHELPRARALIEGFLMGSEGSALARYPELRLTYTGPEGREVDEDYSHALAGYHYRHELLGMHYGEFCNYADYFASKILSGDPNSPDLREGLQTVLVMNAVVEALKSGSTVEVAQLEPE